MAGVAYVISITGSIPVLPTTLYAKGLQGCYKRFGIGLHGLRTSGHGEKKGDDEWRYP